MPSLGQGHLGWIKVLDTFFFGGLDKFAITYKVIFKLPAESVHKFLMKKAVGGFHSVGVCWALARMQTRWSMSPGRSRRRSGTWRGSNIFGRCVSGKR